MVGDKGSFLWYRDLAMLILSKKVFEFECNGKKDSVNNMKNSTQN